MPGVIVMKIERIIYVHAKLLLFLRGYDCRTLDTQVSDIGRQDMVVIL